MKLHPVVAPVSLLRISVPDDHLLRNALTTAVGDTSSPHMQR